MPEDYLFERTGKLVIFVLLQRVLHAALDDSPAVDRVERTRRKFRREIRSDVFIGNQIEELLELGFVLENLLRGQVRFDPILFQDTVVRALHRRVHRRRRQHAAPLTLALDDGEVLGDRRATFVAQLSRALIADPAVNTATTGIDPQQVLETEILAQADVEHLERHRHQRPALSTDPSLLAARPHVVVIRHIDIKNQLPLLRF